MDIYNLTRDNFYRESGLPDIIDVRPLMSARDELVLPKDELFTASDVRPLIILPFSSYRLKSLPADGVLRDLPFLWHDQAHLLNP